MSIQPGSFRLGPGDGALVIRTGRTGAAAKAGHNLVIDVGAWEGTLDVGDDPGQMAIGLDADPTSLRVLEGTGGMQSLGEDDKADIQKTIDDEVLQRKPIAFRSTRVEPAGEDGLSVQGELTLAGQTRPIAFELTIADGATLRARAVVKQSDWGMKPYSALFGALKVADEVEIEIDAALPSG
jgi:hypothetical protein